MRASRGWAVLLWGAGLAPAWAAGADEEGRRLFIQGATPPCAVCHTLRDAGSQGAVGPVLDELKPDAARVATALRNGVGAMPPYRGVLSEAQILALAAYVAKVAGR